MNKQRKLLQAILGFSFAIIAISGSSASAQVPSAIAAPAAPAAPSASAAQTVALVSAIGDQFTFVRENRSVGTNIIDTSQRKNISLNSRVFDHAVLRGLDSALEITEPNSRRELVVMRVPNMEGVTGSEREAKSLAALTELLRNAPERARWDKIIAVLPSYMFSAHNGMGSKLTGIGVYVQPLERGEFAADGGSLTTSGIAADGDERTMGPDGQRTRSSVYVAPYFFVRLITMDAKTLQITGNERRLEYRKMYDPESSALDVQNQFTNEQLAMSVEKFVERASREVVAGKGTVSLGEPKIVPAKP